MNKNIENRTIALAALFQCVEGVRQLAHDGKVDQDLFHTCINSVATQNTHSIQDIYEGLCKLKTGFKEMLLQLGGDQLMHNGKQKNMETTRYAINLLHLEKKLNGNAALFKTLLDGITDIQRQLDHFEPTDETIVSHLAEIYSESISQLGPRIMVKGNQDHLGRKENAAKIRALLLSGIRASLLWRQAGGSRWKLLLERGKLQRQATEFIESC